MGKCKSVTELCRRRIVDWKIIPGKNKAASMMEENAFVRTGNAPHPCCKKAGNIKSPALVP